MGRAKDAARRGVVGGVGWTQRLMQRVGWPDATWYTLNDPSQRGGGERAHRRRARRAWPAALGWGYLICREMQKDARIWVSALDLQKLGLIIKEAEAGYLVSDDFIVGELAGDATCQGFHGVLYLVLCEWEVDGNAIGWKVGMIGNVDIKGNDLYLLTGGLSMFVNDILA